MSLHAVIDLGTQAVLLLIATVDERHHICPGVQRFRYSGLGQGLKKNGRLASGNMQATLKILDEYKQIISGYGPDIQVTVLGTEALRKAQNGCDFAEQIVQRFGWPVQIISAQDEARLSFLGVCSGLDETTECWAVLDVGGGSSELAIGRRETVETSASLPIGALTLAEQMKWQINLCSSDRLGLMQIIKLELRKIPFLNTIGEHHTFITYGGTISTMAAIKEGMKEYDSNRINRVTFSRSEIWDWFFLINEMSLAQRRTLAGMEPGRELVLPYGLLIILTLMELGSIEYTHVSDRGLRFGWLVRT